jgi:rhodanese-related sulfurtransferase
MNKSSKLATVAVAVIVGLTSAYTWANCGSCEEKKDKKADCKGGVCAVSADKGGKTCAATEPKAGVINTAGMAALLQAKTPVTVLDARSGKYDDGRRIPGAQQLSPTADAETVAKVVADKNALIVTYCAGVTCPASDMLAKRLKEFGYSNVIEYPQGIAGWAEDGKAVEQKGK